MKKKIVIVSPAFPYRGGQALVESYLFNALEKFGYDCQTVSFTLLYPSVFFPGTSQYEKSGFVAFPHSDKIKRLINSVNPVSWMRTAKFIKDQRPDAVVFVWWMPFFGPAYFSIIKLLKLIYKTKIIFLMENFISHENRWFDKFFAKLTVRNADAFICQSGYVNEQLSKAYAGKPVYQTTLSLYDCYDLKKFDKSSAKTFLDIKTKYVVLFFGLIRAYKGLDRLIEAFPLVLKSHPDTTLLIAGENYENFGKYQAMINSSGVDVKIKLHIKYIPNEEMEPYFKAADVVCLPYYSATQSGIVMLAYGFRKPVMVTDTGGLKELVVEGKTGTVIHDNNPVLIAEGVERILQSDNVQYEKDIDDYVQQLGYKNLEAIFRKIVHD